MATISITIRARAKSDNTHPVVIRIRHNNGFFDISTGESVVESKFDKRRGAVIGNKSLQKIWSPFDDL